MYSNTGGAVNYLCLPNQPPWLSRTGGAASLYGGEYGNSDFGTQNGDDVTCAVCRIKSNSVLMIPARTSCYSGWTRQYNGYLGAGESVQKAGSEYICVDINAEAVPRGRANDNSKLIYRVQAYCGSLPCPPYEYGKSATCVVCSK